MSKKLVKRIRRKAWGGRLEMRVYDDNSCRVRFDHPSNDPAIEMAAVGAVAGMAHKVFASYGIEVTTGAMRWNDDP